MSESRPRDILIDETYHSFKCVTRLNMWYAWSMNQTGRFACCGVLQPGQWLLCHPLACYGAFRWAPPPPCSLWQSVFPGHRHAGNCFCLVFMSHCDAVCLGVSGRWSVLSGPVTVCVYVWTHGYTHDVQVFVRILLLTGLPKVLFGFVYIEETSLSSCMFMCV